jgi:hypothetical protein
MVRHRQYRMIDRLWIWTASAVLLIPTITSTAAPTETPTVSLPAPPPARAYAAPPIQIPANYRDTFTHYATVGRTDSGGAVRVMYITPAAITAFQATGVFPVGTLVIMEIYHVQPAATGGFATDAEGRLVPGPLQSVLVKLKIGRDAIPSATGNTAHVNQRGWVYASFDATTGNVDGFNQPLCQSCHVQAQAWDDLFTRPELLAFSGNDTTQYFLCELSGRQPCQEPDQ